MEIDETKRALDEWKEIAVGSQFSEDRLRWIERYCDSPAAGRPLSSLLRSDEASSELQSVAKVWILRYPSDASTPGVLEALLNLDASPDLIQLAREYASSTASKFSFNDNDSRALYWGHGRLLNWVLKNHLRTNDESKQIEDLIHAYPRAPLWHRVFPIFTPRGGDRRIELLTAFWLEANSDNPELETMSPPMVTPCAEVNRACLLWAENFLETGFHSVVAMTWRYVMQGSDDPKLLDDGCRLARKWLQLYPDNDRAGSVHHQLILSGRSTDDVQEAKRWYQAHRAEKGATWALAGLLKLAHLQSTTPDPELVIEAKLAIGGRKDSWNELFYALLRVAPDEDNIRLAEQKAAESSESLAVLLEVAPHQRYIEQAKTKIRRADSPLHEVGLVYALLKLDPSDSHMRQLAVQWIVENPDTDAAYDFRALLQLP